jgi:hypothetical protein
VVQVVEGLSSKSEALISNPSTEKKKKKKRNEDEMSQCEEATL